MYTKRVTKSVVLTLMILLTTLFLSSSAFALDLVESNTDMYKSGSNYWCHGETIGSGADYSKAYGEVYDNYYNLINHTPNAPQVPGNFASYSFLWDYTTGRTYNGSTTSTVWGDGMTITGGSYDTYGSKSLSINIIEQAEEIQKTVVEKYKADIKGLQKASWLDKANIAQDLSETERSKYILALIDIVNQYREIGSKMPLLYFNEDYSETVILYQDVDSAVELLISSQDGPNGKEWVLKSVEKN